MTRTRLPGDKGYETEEQDPSVECIHLSAADSHMQHDVAATKRILCLRPQPAKEN